MSGVSNARVLDFKSQTHEIRDMAQAAINNEAITRQRVEGIEAVLSRPLWGRLRWLFLGR